jgi:hypothetical protein
LLWLLNLLVFSAICQIRLFSQLCTFIPLYSFGYKFIQSFLFMKGLIQNSTGKLKNYKTLWICLLKCTTTLAEFLP